MNTVDNKLYGFILIRIVREGLQIGAPQVQRSHCVGIRVCLNRSDALYIEDGCV